MNELLPFCKIPLTGVAGITCFLGKFPPKQRIVKGLSVCADICPL
jgi:hypothetical protein